MNSTTMTKPPAGQQVRITGMPGNAHNGEIGTVSDAYSVLTPTQIAVVIPDTPPPVHQNGCWIVDAWETVYPNLGDKVIPLPDDGNWYGIPEEYRNAVGTVVEIGDYVDGNGKRFIAAEFQSYRKPDDTERWSFYWCKPADGHTLTVSDPYRPEVGDKVTITGYLSSEGIIDTVKHDGYIRAVDGDIWTIDSPLYGRQVSGPGYITLVLAASDAEPVRPSEEPRIITELRDEADTLKRELDRANERVEEFRNRASMWQRDFTKYADRILEEAINRDWCEEYERVMASIQSNLEVAVIPEREQEFEVEVTVTGTMTTTTTVTVTARSQEDADEMVSENMDDYVDADDILTDAARHRSFDNIECDVE